MAHAPDSTPGPRDDATNASGGNGEHTNVTATDANDPNGTDDTAGAPEDLKNSFRDALARKAGRNSHVEAHLDGRHIGGGNNDTHKRQFRRKSG